MKGPLMQNFVLQDCCQDFLMSSLLLIFKNTLCNLLKEKCIYDWKIEKNSADKIFKNPDKTLVNEVLILPKQFSSASAK